MGVDPVGASIGAASLAIQLLDTAAAGFALFLAAGNMQASCLELRTKLEMEQSKLLAFAEATGLLDLQEGDRLPDSLESEKLTIIAVLTQIGCKLDDFSSLTNRYEALQKKDQSSVPVKSVQEEFLSLQNKWQKSVVKSQKRRERLRGTNHMFKWFGMGYDIVKEPERIWWAAFDEKVFKRILGELIEYNNYLFELSHGQHARKLEKATREIYLELVLVRNELNELTSLLTGSSVIQDHQQITATPKAAKANEKYDSLLKELVDTKSKSITIDKSNEFKLPGYEEATGSTKVPFKYIELAHEPKAVDGMEARIHTSARYWANGRSEEKGSPQQVWVEWKPYRFDVDEETKDSIPSPASVKRVRELVALLQGSRLSTFRIPTCLGWFDYRDDANPESESPALFGIIFRKLDQSDHSSDPVSLLHLIKTQPCPSLSARAALAHKLADSVLYLHAVRWLHKSIRSDGIIFLPPSSSSEDTYTTPTSTDITEPFMTGFEYSRPDHIDAHSTHILAPPQHEAYVHPFYQGAMSRSPYQKAYDVYSLGIVLLEIAYWSPLLTILADEFATKAEPSVVEVRGIQETLITSKPEYLDRLRGLVGERFHTAVASCLSCATPGNGDGDPAKETSIQAAAEAQRDFARLVVDNLASVVV